MRISEAAQRLGLSARMLRYRESLGLLPAAREPVAGLAARPGGSRSAVGPAARLFPGPGPHPAAPRPGPHPPAPGARPLDRTPAGQPGGPATASIAGRAARPPGARHPATRGAAHRHFDEDDLAVAALALDLERQLDVSPAELSFGIRVLAEPAIRTQVAALARQLGRIPAPPGRALDFEQERALRLLRAGQPGTPPAGRRTAAPPAGPPPRTF